MIRKFQAIFPKIHETAFITDDAMVIGDVEIGEDASVWYGSIIRGDVNYIRIGARTNIQDGTIIHVDFSEFATYIGDDVSIGHAAIVHACTLKNRAFVAMGATIMDGAVIEEGGMLGAGALLPPGKVIGPNELWLGSPARLKRVMSAEERAGWDQTAVHYAALGARFRAGMRPAG